MTAPRTLVKVTSTWREAKKLHVKVSSTWRRVKYAYVKVAGVWRKVHAGVFPGSQSFTTAGTTSFTVPYYNTMTVEIWGGGGSGGCAYHGGSSARGGNGGNYVKYTLAPGALTPESSYTVVVGAAGAGVVGNKGGKAGGYSQFANRVWAQGGKGGNGSEVAGENPATYTPTESATGFTLSISETGGVGGLGAANGGSVTYAGGGGGGCVNDYGEGDGGTSTYGGAGGNGGDGWNQNAPRTAYSPAGGGGSTDWDSPAGSGPGGVGKIYISWS